MVQVDAGRCLRAGGWSHGGILVVQRRVDCGQSMTPAAIGRVLGEHEATVSRKLDKARKTVRKDVELVLGNLDARTFSSTGC